MKSEIKFATTTLLLTATAQAYAQGGTATPTVLAASPVASGASGPTAFGWRRPDVIIGMVAALVIGIAIGYWLRGMLAKNAGAMKQ